MRSLRGAGAREPIVARVTSLTEASERQWGTMETAKLLPHLSDALQLCLGDIPSTPSGSPLRFSPVRHLVIHVLPWPRGGKAPPEAFTTRPSTWSNDREQLLALIERFAVAPDGALAGEHPLFGRMTARLSVLMYRHLDQHLTQFGA